jgi:hypothetical protein
LRYDVPVGSYRSLRRWVRPVFYGVTIGAIGALDGWSVPD